MAATGMGLARRVGLGTRVVARTRAQLGRLVASRLWLALVRRRLVAGILRLLLWGSLLRRHLRRLRLREAVPYAAAYPPAETAGTTTPPTNGDATDFYTQALAAFQQGDYRNATRLAGHASIDDPRNPDVHVLLMQGLFAIGEYRGAAMEAHAVVSLGKTPDWAKLYGLYGAVEPYTEQLRALEKYAGDKPSAAEGRFLLGFQYLMTGHPEAAQNEFLQALKLTPKDRLAAQLLKEVGGTVPPEIAKQLWPSPPPPKTFDSAKKGK